MKLTTISSTLLNIDITCRNNIFHRKLPLQNCSYPIFLVIITPSECIGKLNLLKAQFCAFNTSDSTTIPLTVQNWQIKS